MFTIGETRVSDEVCSGKKNKGKIARCSGMSKFCPPATASRESIRGNQYH